MRIISIVFVSLLFIACNGKEETPKKATKIVKTTVEKPVKLPVFKDSLITNYITEYDAYTKAYLTAIKNKNSDKIAELQTQSAKLIKKAELVSRKLNTPAKLEKFQKWLSLQQQKIETLTTK